MSNAASIRILERAGFLPEEDPHGDPEDDLIYVLALRA
jgi:hypothetical protein